MKKYEKCKTCGCFHWTNESCGKKYIIHHPDYLGENGKVIYGYSFMEAAEKYAEYYDEDEHPLLGDSIEIWVESENGERKLFELSAEPAINYYANEVG